jgi:outer membrane protein OmpA-like peptidoglycan-associated protein
VGRDSVLRVKQLMNYYRYNLSVNRDAIDDPTLVPLQEEFSFIADPNQHKSIEIAFYRGGIIEGYVEILSNGEYVGQSGLRLNLRSDDADFQTVLRTMNDGSFYAMELHPGKYTLEVDSTQLGFLNVCSEPAQLHFEIRALSEGDYLEGLKLTLIPLEESEAEETEIVEAGTKIERVDSGKTAAETAADTPEPKTTQELSAEQEKLFSSGVTRERRGVIAFTFASAELTKDSAPAVLWMANNLKSGEWKALTIYGNADSTGEEAYNMILSIKRADAVKEALVRQGISELRIRTVGNGENKPFATNETKEGRRLNRRIDLEIVE